MFNVWSFRGFGGIVSSGLEGGSLNFDNVSIGKDPKTLVKEEVSGGGVGVLVRLLRRPRATLRKR